DRDVSARTKLSVVSTAAEVVDRAGRPDAAMPMLDRLRQQILADEEAPDWARVAVETQQLVMWARSSEDHAEVVNRARVVLGDASNLAPVPPVLEAVVASAGVLIGR